MNDDPSVRPDFSKFLVHLTRNNQRIDAEDNLINILKDKTIEARNFHCLFAPNLKKMEISSKLKNKFKTVCFTETPLDQIHRMTSEKYKRNLRLRPYGLVFWRLDLIKKGANPAIYINGKKGNLRNHLLNEFKRHFKNINKFKTLSQKEEYYEEIVRYYSLINVIAKNYDFCWEREWRFNGNFQFFFDDIVAIVAEDPDKFEKKCKKQLSTNKYNYIKKIPIISTNWCYEEVIEQMSFKLWNLR